MPEDNQPTQPATQPQPAAPPPSEPKVPPPAPAGSDIGSATHGQGPLDFFDFSSPKVPMKKG